MATVLTDNQVRANLSANIQRILVEQGRTRYWLMRHTGESPGRIYPIIAGDTMPQAGIVCRIAEALGVSVDEIFSPIGKNLQKVG